MQLAKLIIDSHRKQKTTHQSPLLLHRRIPPNKGGIEPKLAQLSAETKPHHHHSRTPTKLQNPRYKNQTAAALTPPPTFSNEILHVDFTFIFTQES